MKGALQSATAVVTLMSALTIGAPANSQTARVTAPPPVTRAPVQTPSNTQTSRTRTAPRSISNPSVPQADVQQPALYTALAFTVTTGDDDLRSDSSAWVDLTFPDLTKERCTIRDYHDDTWDNNSTHDAPQCVLSAPKTFDQLKATKVVLNYSGTQDVGFFNPETTDNWNVNKIHIDAANASQHLRSCLIDAAGSPLVRMKGSLPSFDVTQAPNSC